MKHLTLKTFLLSTLLFSNALYASDEKEAVADTQKSNSDGTDFKAPRLAGDSLPIAGFKDKEVQTQDINSLQDMFANGKVKGLIRYSAQHRDTKLHNAQDTSGATNSAQRDDVKQYSAIGGYLGYETAAWYNLSLGATFYTSHPLGNNPAERGGLGGLDDSSATGSQDSYTVLGEAFVQFKKDEHLIKVGRQEMPDYRFISLSNIRMTPLTHEGYIYENTVFEGLQLNLAYITKMKERNSEEFIDMAKGARIKTGCGTSGVQTNGECNPNGNLTPDGSAARGKNLIRGDAGKSANTYYDASGNYNGNAQEMPMFGAIYKGDNYTVEAWDYYVTNFVNTAYLYADYSLRPSQDLTLTAAFQYANQQDVDDSIAGNIDTWFYGLKLQASHDNGTTFFIGYNEVDYNENSYDGGSIFVRWGTPQMFNSFQVQDSELAGVKSYGTGLQLELGKMGIVPNTVIRFRYADYNYPDNINQKDARQDRTESTFDLRYAFGKNDGFGIFTQLDGLSVQFRIAYDDYKTDYDYDAFKNANGYAFDTVTDDFVDTRLYVDYVF